MTTPKPIRCWAVYDKDRLKEVHMRKWEAKVWSSHGDTIIPGRFVPDKPKKRKGK